MSETATIIARNVERVREAIARAARRSGRDPECVRLVAVTKYLDPASIGAVIHAGLTELGENRVQQLVARAAALGAGEPGGWPAAARPWRWHMIGHLQRNKVRALLRVCQVIHSVDSERLAAETEAEAARAERFVDVFVEVNVSGESSKQGVAAADAATLAEYVSRLRHVRLRGLMTMAPPSADPQRARPVFAGLRELLEKLRASGAVAETCGELSMGMTGDYEVAVEEGATVVRIGSALFEGLPGGH
ncbi:MAG: YggS family pyridoxal phosphate-dependent enzyme [Phycisphaerae bacterium]|nr:YggS family pyridoxal phosphate-dependent enzyme [Phycisphaerae bacterium]MCZ2400874.1 YggS family pyridoxal phosphate-dependent enzyme [Phycisphaerae bacterium]